MKEPLTDIRARLDYEIARCYS
uniref:Uncharacterized protein n=1 Tax=Arundo donax TaxID=35708 RepID=A0A0A9CAS9_ARUDO